MNARNHRRSCALAGAIAKAEELGMTVVEHVLYSKEYSEKTAVEMDNALVKFGVRFLLSSTNFFLLSLLRACPL